MGGHAFTTPGPNGEPPLSTPRMSPSTYIYLKKACYDIVKTHYAKVTCLADAPEKHDFGDIDFLVQGPHSADANSLIAIDLDAKRTLTNSLDFTIAIPYRPRSTDTTRSARCDEAPEFEDEESLSLPEIPPTTAAIVPHAQLLYSSCTSATVKAGDASHYAQVDIRNYPASLSLSWISYLHSYGDLGQILGFLSYDLGITSNDKGFFVRIAQQQRTNWYGSMIFLSRDPSHVMRFLGLDCTSYHAGFRTEAGLFDWVKKSRTAKRFPHSAAPGADDGEATKTKEDVAVKENSEHKRRMETRHLFSRFVKTVLPTLTISGKDISDARTEILHDALVFFDKREEYDTRLRAVLAENADEAGRVLLVELLKGVMKAKKEKVNEVVRGMRNCVRVACASAPPSLPTSHSPCSVKEHPPLPNTILSHESPSCMQSAGGSLLHTATSVAGKEQIRLEISTTLTSDEGDQMRLGCLVDEVSGRLKDGVADWVSAHWEHIKNAERARSKAAKAIRSAVASTTAGMAEDGNGRDSDTAYADTAIATSVGESARSLKQS